MAPHVDSADSPRTEMVFQDREDAAVQLAAALRDLPLDNPLVLAIPRGGVVTGAVLARELGADLDIILARKLRAPGHPEAAIGAVSESGEVYLTPFGEELGEDSAYLRAERLYQLAAIAWRNRLLRAARPPVPIEGRTVIVTDDGIATGSTMIGALKEVGLHKPGRVIVAVPVASQKALDMVRLWSDDVVCLLNPPDFMAVGQYYLNFHTVEDNQVVALLRRSRTVRHESSAGVS
jgi:predicted phosphoribosyltransferase